MPGEPVVNYTVETWIVNAALSSATVLLLNAALISSRQLSVIISDSIRKWTDKISPNIRIQSKGLSY